MPTQEDMQNNRQRALGAAYRCFMAHGFQQTSIDMVAKEAGLSSRSIRRYFGSQKDLIYEVIEKVLNPKFLLLVDEMRRSVMEAASGIEQVEQLLIKIAEISADSCAPLLRLMEAQLVLFQNQSKQGAQKELISANLEACRLLQESIARGVKDGSILPNIDQPMTASLILNLFVGFLQRLDVTDYTKSEMGSIEKQKQVETLIRSIVRNLSD